MVFYFTGTGNSLYIAKELESTPISIPQIMGREDFTFTADWIGIVCPIYGHEMPAMVKGFLQKAVFHTDYFYVVLTYGNRSEEEKAADFNKENTGLFFFRGKPNAPFAIVSAGGGFSYVGSIHESFPHALELSRTGYNAFVAENNPVNKKGADSV